MDNEEQFKKMVAEVEGEVVDSIRTGDLKVASPEAVAAAMKLRIYERLEDTEEKDDE